MKRRAFLESALLAGAGTLLVARRAGAGSPALRRASSSVAPLPTMTIYKSPSCGCCKDWVTHVQRAGFTTKVIDMDDLSQLKRDAGVTAELESCHTALVGSYVIEGHVPADLVKKVLTEKPKITGLTVAGMVVGSPGMEQGSTKQPYNVLAFVKGGKTSVYARR